MYPLIPYFDATNIVLSENLTLKTPGFLAIVGLIAGTFVAIFKARRDDLQTELICRVIAWLIVGIFVGGHLGYLLFYYPETMIADPASLFRVWEGQSSLGGFIMCSTLGLWFFRREIRKRQAAASTHLPPINIWA